MAKMMIAAVVAALAVACASPAVTGGHADRAVARVAAPLVVRRSSTVAFKLGRGHATAAAELDEPSGVILLYRLQAPLGTRARATIQLPSVSAPLAIATTPVGPSSWCRTGRAGVTCIVGEEGCPMPAGRWRVLITKLSGPPGDVTIRFRVGTPPGDAR